MNHVYRLCWNRALRQWVAASELAQCKRGMASATRHSGRRLLMLSTLSAALGMTGLAHAGNSPSGGQIVAGSGQISQSGNTTTIRQNSNLLSLNWQNFDIGADQTVNFLQPGAGSIAVNRILGNTATQIYGHLNANGQVWLINPNGVLFGRGSQVNVGGIVASTLDLDDGTFGSSSVRFAGDGKGKIINQGSLIAANGGYVALIGNQVSNQGLIRAQLGTAALAGGSAVTMTFNGNHLLHLEIDKNTLNDLVENRQMIVADGGTVLMTAGARDSLLASVVNNTGTVQARSVANHNGEITLLGGMEAGTVQVGGTLDASAPSGGNGGQVETSAANFKVASDARITAAAASGKSGTWLVDPTDLTIDTTAAGTISTTLGNGTSVTEQTTSTGATGFGTQAAGAGDINVNAAITWNTSAKLTLDAFHGINVSANVNGGSSGAVTMTAHGGNIAIGTAGSVQAGAGATLSAAANFTNASTAGANALGSNWLVYSTNPAANTLGGLSPNFIQYNAAIGAAPAASGNGLLYSVAPVLRVSALTGTVSKIYSNTNTANFTGANFTTTGLLNGDKIAAATGGSYASVNVGSNISVTSPGAITNFSIVNGAIPVFGYTLSGAPVSANVGAITPAPLTAQIIGDPTKTYDGTTTATLNSSNYEIDGFVAGQGATVKQPSSIAYTGSDAGSVTLNATFSTTNFLANSGTSLSNYLLPTIATGLGTINQAPLLISGLLANNKTYDGTTADSIATGSAKLFGVIQPDVGQVTLDVSGVTGTFTQANVGNGISVSASGYALTGSKAHDYVVTAPAGLSADITPKQLTIDQVTASNKTYDNTLAATLNTTGATLDGVVGTDNVTLSTSGATAAFDQADVGSNLAVTVSGFSLGGSSVGNYMLAQPTLSANITPALLSISMVGNPTKTYDGTNAATLTNSNFNISGFIGSQSATVSQSSATYATSNVGNGINVTAALQSSDFAVGAGTALSNYTFAPTVFGTGLGKINPLQLSGQIVGNPTKVYDGTTDAALAASNFQLTGLVPGQSITTSFGGTVGGTYDNSNAGARGVSAGALPNGDFTANGGALLSNYILPAIWAGSGTITPAPLTGGLTVLDVGIINATKVYDGTLDISLLPSNFTLSGWVGSDDGVVAHNINGTYGQKNVGTDIPLSATLSTSDLTPIGSTNLSNYTINVPVLGVGNITPAQLTVGIVGNPTKTYNGTDGASLTSSNFNVSGWVTGEGGAINPTATASYDSANASAANGRTITAMLTPGNYVLDAGTLLTNYNVDFTATGTGTINQAPLFITGIFATNKTYSTTTTDSLNTSAAGLSGLVDSDAGDASKVALNLSNVAANFSQANVGSHLSVTATGFNITGSEATNYILQPVTGLFANIGKATLTLSGVTANDKTYDGTRSDSLTIAGDAALNGVFAGDTVGFDSSSVSGMFKTANAGNNLAVSTSGFALNGASAGNYQLTQPAGLTADIDPKALTAVIIGSPTKIYDGTNSATLTASDYELDGFISGQGASVPQSATANYVTKNVGTGLGIVSTLVTSDFVANAGTNLSNYVLPTAGNGSNGVIQPKVVDLTGTRVYDGTTNAEGSLFGVLQGVNGETLGVSGDGTLVTKNVGVEQAFTTLGSLALTNGGNGGLASNYTLIGGTDWVTITPRALTATFDANDKTYDATTNDVLTNAALEADNGSSGLIAGDAVSLGNSTAGHFSNKNVGTGKTVTGNMTISGSDASNYIFTQGTATADIDALHITVSATGKNKQYDATTADPGTTVHSAGVITGDTVNFGFGSANFDTKDVGNGKTVTVAGVTKSGTDAGNYVVDNTTLSTTANITPRIINLSGTRMYDADTDAAASLFSTGGTLSTGFAGETVTLTGQGSTADKNVATNKTVSLGSLALGDGTNGGLSSNYTLIGGTDVLTITKAPLIFAFTASNKVYDGTTAATISNQSLTGLLGSDSISVLNAFGAHFSDKNVGTNKTVFGDMTFGGTDIADYNVTVQTTTANITPLTITVNALGVNKVYDGNTSDNALLSSTGIKAGDSVNFAGTSVFDDKNVGDNKDVAVSGITSSGTDANNYVLANTSTSTTADITPFIINLHSTRVYDGSTNVDPTLFGSSGLINGTDGEQILLVGNSNVANKNVGTNKAFNGVGDMALDGVNGSLGSNYEIGTSTLDITPLAITGNITADNKVYDGTTVALTHGALAGVLAGDSVDFITSGAFADKNAATGKTVTLNSSLGGTDAGNYTYTANSTTTANITPLAITVDATAANKAYDTTTGALITSLTSNGILGSDVVNFNAAGANFSDANAANGKNVTVSGISKSGTDANNYTINTTALTTANITPLVLDLSGTRVYDGTTDADAALFGSNGVLTGIAGQTINLTGDGAVGDKNVGNNKSLTGISGFTLQDGGNGGLAQNYTLIGGTDVLTITPKDLTATTTAVSRDYDGTNLAALTGSALSGLLSGDDVTLDNDTQGTFADKNAGTGKAVSTDMTISGGDVGNYTFTQPTGLSADIDPLHITVDVTAANKNYDTTTSASLTSIGSNGVIGNDDVNFAFGSANFSDANAANGKTVTVTGIAESGADAGNYIVNTTAQTTANILPLVIDLSGTRMYDGTVGAAANLFGNNGMLSGIAGQTINLAGSGNVGDKNVGSNKPFADLGTLTLQNGGNGGLAQNYTLIGGIDTLTITPKAITLGATADNKIYDTTNLADATVTGNGLVSGDDIQFAPGSATFASPNAGNNIAVSVAGITASGADAGNYAFATTASTVADITPVVLDLSGTRVYDGTTAAAAGLFGANGVLTGIAGQTVNLIGIGQMGDKNVGSNKPFSSLGTLGLQDGGNGGLAQNYTLVGGSDSLSITPKMIVLDATGSSKAYDGTTTADVTLTGNGIVGGDQVNFNPGSANYASPNAGNGIAIDVAGITAGGSDANNYSFVNTAVTSGNITPVVLSLTGTRTYDGTGLAAADLFGNSGVLTGVNGETLTLGGSGTVVDKNVGSQKAFVSGGLNGFTLSGNGSALAGNYTLAGGTDWLTITPATLTVIDTQTSNRVYDGTKLDVLSGATLSGVFGNDDIVLGNASTGLFDSKNVGNGKGVTTAMTISGGDVGNYIFVQPTGLTANVTPRPINVTATGTDKMFDGNVLDQVTLSTGDVLAGDQVSLSHQGAFFSDPNVGNGKTVTVIGIDGSGADASNYVIVDPTTTTTANITGAMPSSFGVRMGVLAQLDAMVGPSQIATPYGTANNDSVGAVTGNEKKEHQPLERNRTRTDFTSGLALRVISGGVQMPVNQLP